MQFIKTPKTFQIINIKINKKIIMKRECHYFHISKCYKTAEKCKFLHTAPSLGLCPNGKFCPIKHEEIKCPLQ